MARIRDALRRAETVREQVPGTVIELRPYQPEDAPGRTEIEEEVPFIEVGGREAPIEASASVLASVSKTFSRKQPREPAEDPLKPGRVGSIAFRPFPPEPSLLRPVADRFAPELVALHQPEHPLSEQYRRLVPNLENSGPAGQSQAVLFLAPLPQSDASAVLLNLAITSALAGKIRTVVVDANLHAPVLAERLGLPVAPGLGEVLAERQSLARAIQETGQPNLCALTAGRTTPDRAALVAGEPMRAILRQLRDRFDWILVNAPCWQNRPELLGLGTACDAVYLVLPEAEAETEAVEELSQRLVQQGICLRGYFLI
jgi:Mrp family chromosome partitioning ATPase